MRIGSHKVDAQVVRTETGMESGLGGRKCIGSDQGMLFAFRTSGIYSFWMKDMKFPLDIVWLDEDHSVVWLQRDVSPSTYPTSFFNKEDPAKYVLELKAGTARSLGLKVGSTVSF